MKQSVYRFYQDFFIALILLESREVYLWLKQNKAEALTKARQILNMYNSMYDFSSDAYIKEYRSEFIKNVNRLNKTGKHIYED